MAKNGQRESALTQSWSAAIVRSNLMIVSNLILAAICLLLFIDNMSQDVEVRITPAEIHEQYWIRKNEASDNYKASWAMMMAEIMGNVNPKNVDFLVEQLPVFLSPNLSQQMEAEIVNAANLIKARGIQTIFELQDVQYDKARDLFFAWGTKRTFVKGQPAGNAQHTYEMRIDIKNGRPRIVELATYPGSPAQRPKELSKPKGDGEPVQSWTPYLSDEMRAVINEEPTAAKGTNK